MATVDLLLDLEKIVDDEKHIGQRGICGMLMTPGAQSGGMLDRPLTIQGLAFLDDAVNLTQGTADLGIVAFQTNRTDVGVVRPTNCSFSPGDA